MLRDVSHPSLFPRLQRRGDEDAHEAYDYAVFEAENAQPPTFSYVEDGQTHTALSIGWDAILA